MAMTIGKRITIGFMASVLITAGLGAFTYSKLKTIFAASHSVTDDSLAGIKDILSLDCCTKQIVTNVVLHIQANDPSEI